MDKYNQCNSQVKDLEQWLDDMAKSGRWSDSAARLGKVALRALTGILGDDEDQSVTGLLDNLEAIASRYATKNPDKSQSTAATYQSRAGRVLREYTEWEKDPKAYKGPSARKAARKSSPSASAAPKRSKPSAPAVNSRSMSYPLTGGGSLNFDLPEGGLTMEDAKRLGYFFATLATDFDPGGSAGVGGLSRTE